MNATHGRATLGLPIDTAAGPRLGFRVESLKKLLTAHAFWNIVGLAALIWWATYWNSAVKKWHVPRSPATWYGPYEFISLDFLHNYQASRFWIAGGDPYRAEFGDPIGRKLCYPPIVLVYFSWCKLLSVGKAIAVWTVVLGTLSCLGAYAAWRHRRELGLAPVPVLFALAAVATSAPVAYAMERGNYDLLIVPCILLAAWGLRKTGWRWDILVGYCVGLAICLKVYPGLMLVAVLAMRRYRAAGCVAAFVALFLSFQFHNLPIFEANLRELSIQHNVNTILSPPAVIHSIPYGWKSTWADTRLGLLAKIPGTVAAGVIVGGLTLWIAIGVWRCRDPRPIVLPLLLWLTAAATFVPKVSSDYNLVFLPMAVLALWDRRDPLFVHVGLGLLGLALQPIAFPFGTGALFGIKVAGMGLVAVCLANRLRELDQRPTDPTTQATEGFHVG